MKRLFTILAGVLLVFAMTACDKEGTPNFGPTPDNGGGGGGGGWEIADKEIIGTWTAENKIVTMTLFWTLEVYSDGTGAMKSGMNGLANYTINLKEIVAENGSMSGQRSWASAEWSKFSGLYSIEGDQITLSGFNSNIPATSTDHDENLADFNRTYTKQ